MKPIALKNNQTIAVSEIPEADYDTFFGVNTGLIKDHPERHCVNYFGYSVGDKVRLICCIADDTTHNIQVSSCLVDPAKELPSFTSKWFGFEKFEREIHIMKQKNEENSIHVGDRSASKKKEEE